MAGKGSRARPLSISKSQFDENWERIFNNKKEPKEDPVSNLDDSHTTIDDLVVEFKNKDES